MQATGAVSQRDLLLGFFPFGSQDGQLEASDFGPTEARPR